jgi:hypothetical protein
MDGISYEWFYQVGTSNSLSSLNPGIPYGQQEEDESGEV